MRKESFISKLKDLKTGVKIFLLLFIVAVVGTSYWMLKSSGSSELPENQLQQENKTEIYAELVSNKSSNLIKSIEIPDLSGMKVDESDEFFEEGSAESTEANSSLFIFDEANVNDSKASQFIERFLNTAIVEKHKFGIPICITMAQGIIESNHGNSRLAKGYNNFFGIKCKKSCKGCTGKGQISPDGECVNFTDDSSDDYFKIFPSAWHSFRYRSHLLISAKRYSKLFKINNNVKENPDFYIQWSNELKAAGYATSPKYHKTLRGTIQRLNLVHYDKQDLNSLAKSRGIDLSKIPKDDKPVVIKK